MIVATFGPSTAWVGKTISYDEGRFALEDVGQIAAQAVVDYDRQGHLQWAYDGLREWAYEIAAVPLTAPAAAAPAAAAAQAASAQHAGRHRRPARQAAQRSRCTRRPHAEPPTTPAEPAPAAAAPGGGRKSRRAWFVIGGVVILALLVGIVAAGGRLRDGLGVALTLLAVVAVVALVVAAVRPAAFARWFPGAAPRTLLVTCGAVAAGCFVFAGLLWWMPHYEVIAPTDKRIALDDQPEIKVLVVNRGLLGGTYSAAYSVDGKQQDAIAFPLGGGDGREITLSLPAGVERGPVLLSLGGASVEAQAVAPPAFAVAPLQVDPSPARQGDDVVLTTSVKNTGDIGGTFGGALLVDGQELMKQPIEVAPGQTKDVTYDLTADAEGRYTLQLGDAAAKFIIVKPVRLANGYVVKRSASGGRAHVRIKNGTGADALAVLTRTSNKSKPVVAVYVRKGQTARIKGIPDGSYILWDCCGDDFNWTMRDFYTTAGAQTVAAAAEVQHDGVHRHLDRLLVRRVLQLLAASLADDHALDQLDRDPRDGGEQVHQDRVRGRVPAALTGSRRGSVRRPGVRHCRA